MTAFARMLYPPHWMKEQKVYVGDVVLCVKDMIVYVYRTYIYRERLQQVLQNKNYTKIYTLAVAVTLNYLIRN